MAGLTFVGGYCSGVPSCTSDAECDPANGGRCFHPFHASTADQWTALETSAGVAPGGLFNVLQPYGVCLKTCTAEADCRDPGYTCEAPLGTLLNNALLPGISIDNTQTFCVQSAACFGRNCGVGTCDTLSDGVTATCLCPADFTYDGDTCVPTCAQTCDANATCIVDTANGNAHVCQCNTDFAGDGTTCAPTCATTCGANATCIIDTANGNAHVCACDATYSGDGQTCLPICTPGCGANSTCQFDTNNARVCVCDTGFVFDGSVCIKAACQGACGTNATLDQVDGAGALRCACDAGYIGDGFSCAPIACAPTCDTDASCGPISAGNTAASCVCNAGFLGDGTTSCDANGTVRYVATDAANAMDSGDCTTAATPCKTINYAVQEATAGDVVDVAAGTYPEMVVVDRSLTFRGANAGVDAGVSPASRGSESTVIGFRSPEGVGAHPTSAYEFSVTIDGFTITPQGHVQSLSWATYNMVSLYGGPMVRVVNNVFNGGTWNPACGFDDDPGDANSRVMLCKDMADSAVLIQSGRFEIAGNRFTNYRRPVDIALSGATAGNPVTPPNGVIAGNAFDHIYWRAIWLLDRFGGTVTIEGNAFDATGTDAFNVGSAAVVVTSGGNVFRGNTFTGWSSGVFVQACDGTNTASYAANTYENNLFTGNRTGIQYYQIGTDTNCQVTAEIHGNDFINGLRYAVRWNGDFSATDPPAMLDATGNWFGDAAGAELNAYTYDVALDVSSTRQNVTPYVIVTNPYTTPGGCLN